MQVRPLLAILVLMAASGCFNGTTSQFPPVDGVTSVASLEPHTIGGIEQWLLLRGQDVRNPVLLFVHGGPGAAEMPLNRAALDDLTDEFTMVSWDMRAAGKTYQSEQVATLTMRRFLDDTDEVVDLLRERFDQSDVYLHGHSFGTTVAFRYAREHPEKVRAVIGSGTIVEPNENFIRGNAWLDEQIAAAGDEAGDDAELLSGWRSDVDDDDWVHADYEIHTARGEMLNKYGGISHPDGQLLNIYPALLWQTEYTFGNLSVTFDAEVAKEAFLTIREDDAYVEDHRSTIPSLDMPVLFLSGDVDQLARKDLVEEWFDVLVAPLKEHVVIEKAGHVMQLEQPQDWMAAVRSFRSEVEE